LLLEVESSYEFAQLLKSVSVHRLPLFCRATTEKPAQKPRQMNKAHLLSLFLINKRAPSWGPQLKKSHSYKSFTLWNLFWGSGGGGIGFQLRTT
jgi:hypothetical protein